MRDYKDVFRRIYSIKDWTKGGRVSRETMHSVLVAVIGMKKGEMFFPVIKWRTDGIAEKIFRGLRCRPCFAVSSRLYPIYIISLKLPNRSDQ